MLVLQKFRNLATVGKYQRPLGPLNLKGAYAGMNR